MYIPLATCITLILSRLVPVLPKEANLIPVLYSSLGMRPDVLLLPSLALSSAEGCGRRQLEIPP